MEWEILLLPFFKNTICHIPKHFFTHKMCFKTHTSYGADNVCANAFLFASNPLFIYLPNYLRNGVFPAISVNKDVTFISDSGPQMWIAEPWGQPGRRILYTCDPAAIRLQPLPTVSNEEKWRVLAPDSWDAYESDDFRDPRLLHFPIHRKALNSLTWDIWFSLINNNLLKTGLPCGSAGIKNLLAMWETRVHSLGWEDPLEKGKATHPSLWRRKVRHNWMTFISFW